jgi:hypothetical protein
MQFKKYIVLIMVATVMIFLSLLVGLVILQPQVPYSQQFGALDSATVTATVLVTNTVTTKATLAPSATPITKPGGNSIPANSLTMDSTYATFKAGVPTPTNGPSPTLRPITVTPPEKGVFVEGKMTTIDSSGAYGSVWQEQIGNEWIFVFAGSLKSDKTQGVVMIRKNQELGVTTLDFERYNAPVKDGHLTITSVDLNTKKLTLRSEQGNIYLFDYNLRTFLNVNGSNIGVGNVLITNPNVTPTIR